MTHIYGLIDPRTGEVRYVGQSVHPKERLGNHASKAGAVLVQRWFAQLRALGMTPGLVILQAVARADADRAERFWIRCFMRSNPMALLNERGTGRYRHDVHACARSWSAEASS